MNQKDKVTEIIITLFQMYRKADDENTIKIYCKMLMPVPADILKVAVTKLMYESKFLPLVSEIMEEAKKVAAVKAGIKEPLTAEEAWLEVERQMSVAGPYRAPTWSNPAIAKAIQTIGWRNLCCGSEKEHGFHAERFKAAYKQIMKRRHDTAVINVLAGRQAEPGLLPIGDLLITSSSDEKIVHDLTR